MANAYLLNQTMPSIGQCFQAIWTLTRCMKKAGWDVVAHSDGDTKTAAGSNANDSWGNNIDPLLDTFPSTFISGNKAPWIVMDGPKTLKFIIDSPAVGNFIRGEVVTQATTGATGEITGIVYSSNLSVGHAVISPRTGTFNGTDTITGTLSSATFFPTELRTFKRQIMICKQNNSASSGTITYVCGNVENENAKLFSTLAGSAGCTATIPPGQGGTGNAFPDIAYTVRGTGGSVSNTTFFYSNVTISTNINTACANAIPTSNTSADGSFFIFGESGSTIGGLIFTILDNTEPGEVDNYAWYVPSNSSSPTRTSNTVTTYQFSYNYIWSANYVAWVGWLGRDHYNSSYDIFSPLVGAAKRHSSYTIMGTPTSPQFIRYINHPDIATNPIYVREPITLAGDWFNNYACIKGNARWIQITSNGAIKNTYDNKKWICVSARSNSEPAILIGPWDGATTPI